MKKNRDDKLQYGINRVAAANISASSSGKIDKYHYFMGDPRSSIGLLEEAKFSYSALRKAFEKQTTTIAKNGEKQVEESLESSDKEPPSIKNFIRKNAISWNYE